ncbi:MAG: HlyD family efflux transporter periplasmic adaptor subunit [Candidatus Schekmanbacteria bacterium]|nr:HlyD family efflux transporter periplasmic adaptor subunit [Candidatus Schekmanbacteria bacterium]
MAEERDHEPLPATAAGEVERLRARLSQRDRLLNRHSMALALLTEVSELLGHHLAADRLRQRLAQIFANVVGAAQVVLAICRPAADGFRIESPIAVDSAALARVDLETEVPLWHRVLHAGHEMVAAELAASAPGLAPPAFELYLPVAFTGRPIAVLALAGLAATVDLSAAGRAHLASLANHLGLPISHAELATTNERRLRHLSEILTISAALNESLDVEAVGRELVAFMRSLVAYDRCGLAIRDRGELEVRVLSGQERVNRKDPEIQRLTRLLAAVEAATGAVHFADGRLVQPLPRGATGDRGDRDTQSLEIALREHLSASGAGFFLGVPLVDDELKAGVLFIEAKLPDPVDKADIEVATIVANNAVVALRNARTYERFPLRRFLESRERWRDLPGRRAARWAAVPAALTLILAFVSWPVSFRAPCRIVPREQAIVRAPLDGTVRRLLVEEGDPVLAGEVVAHLQSRRVEEELAAVEADLDQQQRELVAALGGGKQEELALRRARIAGLRERAEQLRAEHAATAVRAPIDGIVSTPHARDAVGRTIVRGGEIMRIFGRQGIEVEVDVPQEEALSVHPGCRVAVKVAGGARLESYAGSVVATAVSAEERPGGSVFVARALLAETGPDLRPGLSGRARVTCGEAVIGALVGDWLTRRIAWWFA